MPYYVTPQKTPNILLRILGFKVRVIPETLVTIPYFQSTTAYCALRLKYMATLLKALYSFDILSFVTFIALYNFKLNIVSFFKSPEAFTLDSSVMHKNVLSSFNGNKTKSLLVIKPLDCSC